MLENPFSDIYGNEYYAGAALWAYEKILLKEILPAQEAWR